MLSSRILGKEPARYIKLNAVDIDVSLIMIDSRRSRESNGTRRCQSFKAGMVRPRIALLHRAVPTRSEALQSSLARYVVLAPEPIFLPPQCILRVGPHLRPMNTNRNIRLPTAFIHLACCDSVASVMCSPCAEKFSEYSLGTDLFC